MWKKEREEKRENRPEPWLNRKTMMIMEKRLLMDRWMGKEKEIYIYLERKVLR